MAKDGNFKARSSIGSVCASAAAVAVVSPFMTPPPRALREARRSCANLSLARQAPARRLRWCDRRAAGRMFRGKSIIRTAKGKRRKEFFAIAVLREGSWLLHQRPDDVSIVNAVAVAPAQPFDGQLVPTAVVNLQPVFIEPDAQPLAPKARRYGVRVVADPDGAPRSDRHLQLAVLDQPFN